MLEISRIVASLGAVTASSGVVIYGIAVSYLEPNDFQSDVGIWLMIVGTIATVAGLVLYRQHFAEED
ncbi:MAG: hypothetical protein H0U38_08430 [Chloroflexia bacterium]|jgi:uncharacterized membrane protein|nr:hypothetical protein [Chloroflexia bacterium]MDQ3614865.1 hypothetical protein [Chloroflexota bacterium]